MITPTRKAAIVAAAVMCPALAVLSGILGGLPGLEGAAVGMLVAAWSISTLAVLVRALMRDRPAPAKGAQQTVLAAFLKLPFTLFGLYIGTTLPRPGIGCFLGGLGLVYCCSVWFLAGASQD